MNEFKKYTARPPGSWCWLYRANKSDPDPAGSELRAWGEVGVGSDVYVCGYHNYDNALSMLLSLKATEGDSGMAAQVSSLREPPRGAVCAKPWGTRGLPDSKAGLYQAEGANQRQVRGTHRQDSWSVRTQGGCRGRWEAKPGSTWAVTPPEMVCVFR